MSPEFAMQGQMAGIQVQGNVGDPLYVIDGIPVIEHGAGIEGTSEGVRKNAMTQDHSIRIYGATQHILSNARIYVGCQNPFTM
jgi:hypothetical protein